MERAVSRRGDDVQVTANTAIDAYAAQVRQRLAAKPSTVRAENRRTARRAADEIRKELPEMSDEQLGAVLLRVAEFTQDLMKGQPGVTAWHIGGLLDAAGEWLYHRAAEPDCGG